MWRKGTNKTITKVEVLTLRKSAPPNETFGALCCSRDGGPIRDRSSVDHREGLI
jgi:hypothetical protein